MNDQSLYNIPLSESLLEIIFGVEIKEIKFKEECP